MVDLNSAQNKDKKREPLDRIFLRSNEPIDPDPVPKAWKKMTVPLLDIMDGVEECPRLQELGAKLLKDEKYCDIDIQVLYSGINQSRTFCAHRSILSLRSSVLNDNITELLKRSTGSQKLRLRVDTKDLNPDMFEYILQFIYTDKFDDNFNLKRNIMHLYAAADYLQIHDLISMIKVYFHESVDLSFISIYLKWAQEHGNKDILEFLLDVIRRALKMNLNEWRQFVNSMCESNCDQVIRPRPRFDELSVFT